MNMKASKIFATILTVALTSALMPLHAASVKKAADAINEIKAENVELKRNGKLVTVDMMLDLTQLKVNRNTTIDIIPAIVYGADTLRLDPVGVYGSTRYVQQQRIGHPVFGDIERVFRSGSNELKQPIAYSVNVPYEKSLEGSDLVLLVASYGCCSKPGDDSSSAVLATLHSPARYDIGTPMWELPDVAALEAREKNTKSRELYGSAYIDFPVNKTEIYKNYSNNEEELQKIRSTLDVVFTDPDVTVNNINIKGFASPEGSYANNERLAEGRTEAVCDYVREIYKLPRAVFTTSYEPENWEGLRVAVEESNIAHRDAILNVIDSDMDPDAKDAAIKNRFPDTYRYLLENVYPRLRRTDYEIAYLVRDYQEAGIIEAVMNKDASKLSPEEFFIAAASHEPGSPEFIAIYALALQYYPDDPTVNYNMAVAALLQGDADAAERRLEKAGAGPEVDWARQKIEEMRENYTE